jgi:hypothetical protein
LALLAEAAAKADADAKRLTDVIADMRARHGRMQAEIATLQKEAAIAARFAALREGSGTDEAPKPGRRSAR